MGIVTPFSDINTITENTTKKSKKLSFPNSSENSCWSVEKRGDMKGPQSSSNGSLRRRKWSKIFGLKNTLSGAYLASNN
jgi:hypothetical protein